MKLVPGETSLVLAGAWNPAILNPPWFVKHCMKIEEEIPVQVFFPMSGSGAIDSPKFVAGDLTYIIRPESLLLALNEGVGSLSRLEDTAANAMRTLEHTPISGVGHNFEFRQSNFEDGQLDVFTEARQDLADTIPDEWQPASQIIQSSFSRNEGSVIVNIARQYDAGVVVVKFNFHHPATSAGEALKILSGENNYARIEANLNLAKELMQNLYGEGE